MSLRVVICLPRTNACAYSDEADYRPAKVSRGERPTRQSGAQRRRPHRALIATPQRSRVTALCSGSYSRPSRVRRRGLFVPELLEQHRTPAVTRRLPAAPSNLSSAPPQAATRLQISRFSLSLSLSFPSFLFSILMACSLLAPQ